LRKINRLESFQYAFAGIWYTLRTQRNAQIHLSVGIVIFILGLIVHLTFIEWAIIALAIGFVLAAEMVNTVAEVAMDYLTTEFNLHVKIIKDVAAGAVLTAAITAVIVGLLILGPPLIELLLLLSSFVMIPQS